MKILGRIYMAVVAAAVMAAGGCTTDSALPDGDGDTTHGGFRVTFTVELPAVSAPRTRAMITEGSVADNAIHDMFILLFGTRKFDNYIDYIVPDQITPVAAAQNPAGNIYTVTATIPEGMYGATVIANWEEYTGLTPADMNLDTSMTRAETEDEFAYDASLLKARGCFVMSGSFTIPADRSTIGASIELVRSLAKINLDASAVSPSGVFGPGEKMFEITEIRVVNTFPDAKAVQGNQMGEAWDVFDPGQLNSADYQSSPLSGADPGDYYTYTLVDSDIDGDNSCIDEIFVAETPSLFSPPDPSGSCDDAELDPTLAPNLWRGSVALLVKGVLSGGDERWFRIDLRMPYPELDNELLHVNLLRNHRYTVNITKIVTSGYATPEQAYNALPGDVETTIDAVNESDMTITAFNGQHQLTVNRDLVEFEYDGDPQTIRIYTDYPGGWEVQNQTSWITVNPDAVGTAGMSIPSITLGKNETSGKRTATFDVVAGLLRLTITINQHPVRDVFAPPGVLGVGAKTGKLTLRGSKEYAGTPVANDGGTGTHEFGPLADETVYVTYFKFGSLIGISGGPNEDAFGEEDIAWTPDWYDRDGLKNRIKSSGSASVRWNYVEWNSELGVSHDGWPVDTAKGLGDPCSYADNGSFSDYIVPVGGSHNGGWNNGMINADGYGKILWANNPNWSIGVSVNNTLGAAKIDDWSIFLPSLGYRMPTPSYGQMRNNTPAGYVMGYYWSSTTGADSKFGEPIYILLDGFTGNVTGSTFNAPMQAESAMPIRCVRGTSAPKAKATRGVYAPPGVLGVGEQSGQLTLRGSNTYKGTAIQRKSEFGPLANEKVYVAYFKWGSAVALGNEESHDVIWRPDGFAKAVGSYGDIEPGDGTLVENKAKGWGDPCALADRGRSTDDWAVPTIDLIETELASDYSDGTVTGDNSVSVSGVIKSDGTAFLPNAGFYDENGTIDYFDDGYYWSSTNGAGSQSNGVHVYSGSVLPFSTSRDAAMPIRCVKWTPPELAVPDPEISAVLAPPGVLGYTSKGELTLRGSKEYAKTEVDILGNGLGTEFGPIHTEHVYVAYFKFGSLIALGSATHPEESNPNAFTSEDIVWAPPGYAGTGSVAEARETARANMPGWGDIKTNVAPGWPLNEAGGYGDPCKWADGGNGVGVWRLPHGGAGNSQPYGYWERFVTGYGPGPFADQRQGGAGLDLWWVRAWDDADTRYSKTPLGSNLLVDERPKLPAGAYVGSWEMFLAVAGYRDASGAIQQQNTEGYYWSGTPNTGNTAGHGLVIKDGNFYDPNRGNANPIYSVASNNAASAPAHAVRCVK